MTIDRLEDCRIAAIESIGSLKSRAADPADPDRWNGPRRPGDPLPVPGIAADNRWQRLWNRSGRLEARAARPPTRKSGRGRANDRAEANKVAGKAALGPN